MPSRGGRRRTGEPDLSDEGKKSNGSRRRPRNPRRSDGRSCGAPQRPSSPSSSSRSAWPWIDPSVRKDRKADRPAGLVLRSVFRPGAKPHRPTTVNGARAPLARAPDASTILASTPPGTQELPPRRCREPVAIRIPHEAGASAPDRGPHTGETRRGTDRRGFEAEPDDVVGVGLDHRIVHRFRIFRRAIRRPATDSEGERIPWRHTYGSRPTNASRTPRPGPASRDVAPRIRPSRTATASTGS